MAIVLGYVPTAEGRAALAFAIEEAVVRKIDLIVVNAGRGESLVDEKFAQPKQLDAVRKEVEDAGLSWHLNQPIGGPGGADEVLEMADKSAATMIVIGTRKRSAVGKLLLGSDAQQILLQASCPVVAVKAGH